MHLIELFPVGEHTCLQISVLLSLVARQLAFGNEANLYRQSIGLNLQKSDKLVQGDTLVVGLMVQSPVPAFDIVVGSHAGHEATPGSGCPELILYPGSLYVPK